MASARAGRAVRAGRAPDCSSVALRATRAGLMDPRPALDGAGNRCGGPLHPRGAAVDLCGDPHKTLGLAATPLRNPA